MKKLTKQQFLMPVAVTMIGFGLYSVHNSSAQDAPPTKQVEQIDVDTQIRQLSDSDFMARETATRKLALAGASAVPALVELAVTGDAEGKHRALLILRKISSTTDDATVTALKEVAQAESKEAMEIAQSMLRLSNASRSGEIPIEDFVIPGMTVEDVEGGLVIKSAGGQRMQVRSNGGKGTSRMIMKSDGNTVIAGSSNAEKALIIIDSQGVIRMTHSTEKGGETLTKAYQYKNKGELEEKNPELHKVFRQFQTAGARIGIVGGDIFGGAGGVMRLGGGIKKFELRVEDGKLIERLGGRRKLIKPDMAEKKARNEKDPEGE